MTEADFVALWKENPRKADALVAEKVMDVVVETDPIMGTNWWTPEAYTTTWEGMGKVVEKMRELGIWHIIGPSDYGWDVEIRRHSEWVYASADTAPLAVAIAAGKALGWIE